MTVSGQRTRAENVAASSPTHGQTQATTSLPPGWGSFCSKPDSRHAVHWYATAPYNAEAINQQYGLDEEQALQQTVDAASKGALRKAVLAQVEAHRRVVQS